MIFSGDEGASAVAIATSIVLITTILFIAAIIVAYLIWWFRSGRNYDSSSRDPSCSNCSNKSIQDDASSYSEYN